MSLEDKGQVNKALLLKVRDLTTELRSIDPTVQVTTVNEAQKLIIEIERLEKELKSAGFFKKRGIKKKLVQNKEKYRKISGDLVNTLLVGFRKIYFDLANNIKEIARFVPQETEAIKKLQIPSFEPAEVIKFSSSVLKIYNQISEFLRGKAISTLVFNREIIETYGKFVDFDEEKIRTTSQITKASIHVMSIPDLLNLYDELEAESAYLKQKRKGTEGKIQVAIIQMVSELLQHLDTVKSISLDLGEKPEVLREQVQEIQSQAENTNSVEILLDLEKRLNALNNEFVNILRTYEISLKTETEEQVGRISQIVGKILSDSESIKTPDIDVSSSSIPKIIQDIEKIRSWHQQTLINAQKIVSTSELINASKTIKAMKIPIPEDFVEEVRELEKETNQSQSLQDWVQIVKRFYDFKSKLAEECQNYFFRLLENPHIQEVISVGNGPQIPTVKDFESLTISDLVNKAREIKDWETRLVAYFSKPAQQSLRQSMVNLYDSRESLRKILSEELKERIEKQRKLSSPEDVEIRELVKEIEGLNRLNLDIKNEVLQAINNEIHPIFNQLTSLETIPPKLKVHVPPLVLDDLKSIKEEISTAADGSIQDLLEQYEKIPVWKYKISTRIRENLKNIPFPLIPVETQFDLREKRNEIVALVDRYAEAGDIESVVREYIGFLEKIEENKNEILVELKKQIENLEGVDKRLYRLFKSQNVRISYSTEREFENLDYSEALTEYWQLNSYIERKAATLAEQMEREISSHIQDYSKLPRQYGKFFDDTVELMQSKIKEIRSHKDLVRLVNIFESYSLESLQMAKDSLAKLHQNLYNWLRVSLPRIGEIIKIDPVVYSAEEKIANFEPDEVSHERLAHKLRQLIFLYDTEIVAILLSQAVNESREVLKNVNDLKEVGINIIEYVGGYIERFSQVIVKNQEDVQLREITEVFVEIDNLQNDQYACKAIRDMGSKYINEIQDAIEYLFVNYQIDLRQDERVDLMFLNKFQEIAAANHVGHLTKGILQLVAVRQVVVSIIKETEKDRNAAMQSELGKLEYYSNIQEVFKRYTDEASEKIYPLAKLVNAREELLSSNDLRYIIELLPQIDAQREEWKKVARQLNRWHRAIRMFRPRYSPSENVEENQRQFKDIEKKINETYPKNRVIRSYLSLVMKLLIELKSGSPLA
ncbi:MAG: hypothetical protein ACTSW1_03555 [Candidatus Hodarchaeales archaeon]